MFSQLELKRLEKQSSDFVKSDCSRFRNIHVFYRNKPEYYFSDIFQNDSGVMHPIRKDHNGDPRCPINGKLYGLFFMGRMDKRHPWKLPDVSPFGEKRVKIPVQKLFNFNTNLFFADFWCHYKEHYVTLVITVKGSHKDHFCKSHLLQLDICDNSYMYLERGGCVQMNHGDSFWVEIFYTESIDLKASNLEFTYVRPLGKGTSTPGGIPKRKSCTTCNLKPISISEQHHRHIAYPPYSYNDNDIRRHAALTSSIITNNYNLDRAQRTVRTPVANTSSHAYRQESQGSYAAYKPSAQVVGSRDIRETVPRNSYGQVHAVANSQPATVPWDDVSARNIPVTDGTDEDKRRGPLSRIFRMLCCGCCAKD